jgi:hypothetical protein
VTARRWTAEQVRQLGVTTDLRTAASIFGLSSTQAYEAAAADRLPFRFLRIGIRYVVPTEPIIQLLGLDGGDAMVLSGRGDAAT